MAHIQNMERNNRQEPFEMKTAPEVLQLLKTCLKDEKPYSLIRVGDGEAMVLNGLKDNSAIQRVMKRQFNMVSFEDAWKIRATLIQALSECDMIGVPFGKKLAEPESYWFRAQQILIENVPTLDKEFCHIDVHYHLQEYYNELFALAPRIYYINCRDIDKRLAEVSGKEVKSYRIAPEMLFTTYEGVKHYPDQFVKIESWMDKQDLKGALCLVGAGVLGKIYCNWFRDRGGIAFDIGSIFDQWAGYVTRGAERGKDKRTNENIL